MPIRRDLLASLAAGIVIAAALPASAADAPPLREQHRAGGAPE
jgi:hypothetical protein